MLGVETSSGRKKARPLGACLFSFVELQSGLRFQTRLFLLFVTSC